MLISLSINNCLIYDTETVFSLQANLQSKRFAQNIAPAGKIHVVKSAIVIGPNNSGKTISSSSMSRETSFVSGV